MQLRLRALLVSFYCMSLLVSMGRPLVPYVEMSVRSGRSFWSVVRWWLTSRTLMLAFRLAACSPRLLPHLSFSVVSCFVLEFNGTTQA